MREPNTKLGRVADACNDVNRVERAHVYVEHNLAARVMGRASITSDPALLRTMAVQTREPLVALRVDVDEAFIHCGKAPKRGRLWDPDAQVAKGTFPRTGEMLHDQITGKYQADMEITRSQMGDVTDEDYRDNAY